MPDAELIATYEPYNIKRIKLESVTHHVFDTVHGQAQEMLGLWLQTQRR